MNNQERHALAQAMYEQSLRRVQDSPTPSGQKFPVGARVRIADDLGKYMRHFPKGKLATVKYTYAHAYGGDNIKDYCLDVDGLGEISWYHEHQLTLADVWPDTIEG